MAATSFWLCVARKRHQAGGRLHAVFQGCVVGTSCPTMIPWYQGFLGRRGRRRHWHWPEICNAVQRGWGHLRGPVLCNMEPPEVYGVPSATSMEMK